MLRGRVWERERRQRLLNRLESSHLFFLMSYQEHTFLVEDDFQGLHVRSFVEHK